MRRIFQIDHLPHLAAEEADRHYEGIHSPFARSIILSEAPRVRRYAWNRVVASRDLRGGFELAPTAWRFILFDINPAADDGGPRSESLLPSDSGGRLLNDHVNFLTNMRPYDVTDEVLVDRRSGQCTSAKFVLTFDSAEDPEAVAARHDGSVLPALVEAFAGAPGARLLAVNRVVAESETAPITHPGQRYTGAFLGRSDRARIDELYFDNQLAGFAYFTDPRVVEALGDPRSGTVHGHLVREWVAVDRT